MPIILPSSTTGKRFTFRSTIRVAMASSDSRGKETQAIPKFVLVADESAFNQRLLVTILEESGYAAAVASSTDEVLHLVEKVPFELLLIDLDLAEAMGRDTIHAMRQFCEARAPTKVPVIALASHKNRSVADKALAEEIEEVVPKPLTRISLVRALAKHLGDVFS